MERVCQERVDWYRPAIWPAEPGQDVCGAPAVALVAKDGETTPVCRAHVVVVMSEGRAQIMQWFVEKRVQ